MKASEKVLSARILTGAIVLSFVFLAYIAHREYGDEISDKVEETVVKYLPDMENSLAKL